MTTNKILLIAASALLLSACSNDDEPVADATDVPNGTTVEVPTGATIEAQRQEQAIPDQWLGRWNGPEGTYLAISREGNEYYLEIANLDGPQTYQAEPFEDTLQFRRNGVVETLQATDGEATGMKWLLDKKNCLTVRTGEGYCRD